MGVALHVVGKHDQKTLSKTLCRTQVTKAFGETQLIVSGATATMLAIGRFAALPYQRRTAESQVPMQNGITHQAAGDE